MRLLDKLAAQLGYISEAKAQRQVSTVWRMLGAESEGAEQDYALVHNQARAYKSSSTVFFCVKQKATTASSYPFQVMQRVTDSEDLEQVANHPFEMLLQKPNEHTTRQELLIWTFSWLSLAGNAYWFLEFAGGEPIRIVRLRPDRVSVVPDKQEYIKAYKYQINGGEVFFKPWEVVHFKTFNPLNDWHGLSDIAAHSLALEGDIYAAKEYNSELHNRGVPPTAVTLSTHVNADTFKRFQADWRRNYEGYENAGKSAILNGSDIDVKTLSVPSRDLQRLEQREYTADQIKEAHGIPLGLYSRNATEANALAAYRTFLRDTIRPMHTLVQEVVTANIILPFYGEEFVGQFESCVIDDDEPRLREMEIVSQGVVDWSGMKRPVVTPDEFRAKYLGLEPFPEDEYPEPEPEPVPAALQDNSQQQSEPEDDAEPDEREDVVEDGADEADKAAEDMRKWRTVALKEIRAGRDPAERYFESKHIAPEQHAQIVESLAGARIIADVKAVFDDWECKAVDLPPVPEEITFSDWDIDNALKKWDKYMPELKGMLDADIENKRDFDGESDQMDIQPGNTNIPETR